MRSWCCKFLATVAVLQGVTCPHFAQAQSRPETLEKLVNSPEAQGTPTVPEAEDSGPNRPAGTLVRPKDGVKHTDLDKAWAEYHETVSKAADGIKAALNKQFDAATAKGDLDAVEKWQAALEKFEKTGELPSEGETKAAVNATASDYKKAKEKLSKAYEAMTKSLTMEKKITEAKAAKAELRMLADTQSSRPIGGETAPNKPQKQMPQRPNAWPPLGSYIYYQTGGWTAPITIEEDGVSRCEGRLGKWSRIDSNAIRITFWTGTWIEVCQGREPGTLTAYRTHDGRSGTLKPENAIQK
jgi:hypothetical protein